MGQKCSCLFNKEGEMVFTPEGKQDENKPKFSKSKSGVHSEYYNIEYSKAVQQKTQSEKGNDKTPQDHQENDVSENFITRLDPSTMDRIVSFQSLFRSFKSRKLFKKKLHQLKEEEEKLFQTYESKFRTQNLYLAESEFSDPYEPNGWLMFYPPESTQFTCDYGRVFEVKILLYDDGKAYYSGQVNIHYQKHGYGKLVNKDGSKFQGFWIADEFTGWGRMIDIEGSFYQGK
jgi:hypothetical protein